jgi:hypothetical protein
MWVGRTRQSSGVISKESCYSASVSKTPASASQPQSKPHLKAISATISAVTDCLCRDHTCHGLSGRSPPSFANQAWLDVVRSSDASGMQDCDSSTVAKEGTHTPEKHERPGQRPGRASVEVLAAYSHSAQAADLRLCHTVALHQPCVSRDRARSVHQACDRLHERDITDLITAYRDGATAAPSPLPTA